METLAAVLTWKLSIMWPGECMQLNDRAVYLQAQGPEFNPQYWDKQSLSEHNDIYIQGGTGR